MVLTGIEPVTNGLLDQRATDCAITPTSLYNEMLGYMTERMVGKSGSSDW